MMTVCFLFNILTRQMLVNMLLPLGCHSNNDVILFDAADITDLNIENTTISQHYVTAVFFLLKMNKISHGKINLKLFFVSSFIGHVIIYLCTCLLKKRFSNYTVKM